MSEAGFWASVRNTWYSWTRAPAAPDVSDLHKLYSPAQLQKTGWLKAGWLPDRSTSKSIEMPARTRRLDEKSTILTVAPIEYSLTEGTDIPPPSESPEISLIEPPLAGGGPLSSHPTTPPDMPGAYPSSDAEGEADEKMTPTTPSKSTTDDYHTASPVSPTYTASPPRPTADGRPSGVRRLFSLNNLRTSFSSSRQSLSLARPSTPSFRKPSFDRLRSASPGPSMMSVTPSSDEPGAKLRRRKSGGSWFRRRSSMLMMNYDDTLDSVQEDSDARDAKRIREVRSPPPLLPEVATLSGGRLTGGDMGWDESAFGRF